ncbi:ROK family protein [Cyclobacterium amurskyense]|jgi:glucokinase|uniref:ROK family protein n=1 Tax=Cyclobacterium amurskyense TaxID=320787 RepID=A0A0H4PSW8_9BACT|nr:ROK family protein [Cyclobacterium amurskyense]AKP51427.1 ROK family protein [Cyclobacterium amurskyense]|tara:strand:- start:4196 stop:5053 length:858 start_codon:yes stop_codon:yes gene_type:complete
MNIGIDLGGTKIQVGIEQEGKIIHKTKALLKEKTNLQSTLDQVIQFIKPLAAHNVDGIGIGVPSVVDVERGIVYNVTNIPSWKKVALKDILEEEFNLPVFVNNDVNCFAIGEHKFGMGKKYRNMVGMSIGTGLGSGIIIGNKLYAGINCGAGEIGLLPYLKHNIEYYASGNFFSAEYGTTALDAFTAAKNGDKEALVQWNDFGRHFGAAVQVVMYTYDPEAIVIGGSVANAFPYFENAMRESFSNFIYPESFKKLKIHLTQNEDIAILGAAALVDESVKFTNKVL